MKTVSLVIISLAGLVVEPTYEWSGRHLRQQRRQQEARRVSPFRKRA